MIGHKCRSCPTYHVRCDECGRSRTQICDAFFHFVSNHVAILFSFTMALDEPSAQLFLDIRSDVQSALATRRPILHHLNADTSWFLQIPRPVNELEKGSRYYYNVLIDPWLSGGQSDVASWFSQQFHAHESAVPSIAALEELAREIEILATEVRLGAGRKSNRADVEEKGAAETFIDVVAVSHEFTDHCHKETLLKLHPDVPVFAIPEAAKLISSWKHFKTVIIVESFGANGNIDWRSTSILPLPEWIGISRLLSAEDVLYYHSALMVAFNNTRSDVVDKLANSHRRTGSTQKKRKRVSIEPDEHNESAEAIVYTPHGIHSGDLNILPKASPSINTLAFLHGLHNVRVGTLSGRTALQLNLGAVNGLKAQRLLKAKYWVSTHDEIKKGGGLVSWFLQRDTISVQQALEEEKRAKNEGQDVAVDGDLLDAFEGTNWVELGNGESRVLV